MNRLGILSFLAINIVGTQEAPDWEEADLISDCSVNGSYNEADASTRRTAVAEAEPTNMTLEITGKLRFDSSDPAYIALRNAYLSRSPIDVLGLNGSILVAGHEGFRFTGKIFGWTEDQGLQSVLFKDFTIKPCISDNIPQFARTVGDSAGVTVEYTNIGENPDA